MAHADGRSGRRIRGDAVEDAALALLGQPSTPQFIINDVYIGGSGPAEAFIGVIEVFRRTQIVAGGSFNFTPYLTSPRRALLRGPSEKTTRGSTECRRPR